MLKRVKEEVRGEQRNKNEDKQEFEYVNMNDPQVQDTHNYFKDEA